MKLAVEQASAALDAAGVRHTIIGGLAVAAHGHLRATEDVDFLVGDEAFESSGLIVSFVPGLPILVGDIKIDYVPITEDETFLEDSLCQETIDTPALVYMKLRAGRRKDKDDVVQIIEAGADINAIIEYLSNNAPDLLPVLDKLLQPTYLLLKEVYENDR